MANVPQPASAPTYQSLRDSGLPFIAANRLGMVYEINEAFEATFGWARRDLVGESLSLILPEAHKMSHQLAFSRFQLPPTESAVLGHPLQLATRCADGKEIVSEHFIIAEERAGEWYFAATLKPLTQAA
jgi:PAS domain S-box-containing protein